jgi:hypothetical protein
MFFRCHSLLSSFLIQQHTTTYKQKSQVDQYLALLLVKTLTSKGGRSIVFQSLMGLYPYYQINDHSSTNEHYNKYVDDCFLASRFASFANFPRNAGVPVCFPSMIRHKKRKGTSQTDEIYFRLNPLLDNSYNACSHVTSCGPSNFTFLILTFAIDVPLCTLGTYFLPVKCGRSRSNYPYTYYITHRKFYMYYMLNFELR